MFKITIVDMETGETEVDAEASCIIGGLQIPKEKAAQVLGFIDGPVKDVCYALDAADNAIRKVKEDPRIDASYSLLSALKTFVAKED